ncbi:hypothetical protein DYB32_000607 [Aphanomyces invadans]|uniref:Exonuclease 1 n=1 Tax=Aphanomyces invadans TaxID=157072 RepID=A0A418B9E5_9STRA|nr:hypothetical protein DYB32_000607 [Aphanomyces invadans]
MFPGHFTQPPTSPFEADAQMVYLCKVQKASAIITEDSDILVYSITANVAVPILLKLDYPSGACKIVSKAILKAHGATAKSSAFLKKLVHFLDDSIDSIRMFVQMCVLSGCDFLESLPNIGPVTAQKHVFAFRGAPGHLRMQRILSKLKMDNSTLAIPSDYLDRCRAAEALFYHHYVYNPDSRACEHLVNATDLSMTKDIHDLVTCMNRGPSIVGDPSGSSDCIVETSDRMHTTYHGLNHSTQTNGSMATPSYVTPPPAAPSIVVEISDDEVVSTAHDDCMRGRPSSSKNNTNSAPQATLSQRVGTSDLVDLLDQYRRSSTRHAPKRPTPQENLPSDLIKLDDECPAKKSRHVASVCAPQDLFESLQAMPEPSGKSPSPSGVTFRRCATSVFATSAGKVLSSHQTPPSATKKKAAKPLASAKGPTRPSPTNTRTLHAFFAKKSQPPS